MKDYAWRYTDIYRLYAIQFLFISIQFHILLNSQFNSNHSIQLHFNFIQSNIIQFD